MYVFLVNQAACNGQGRRHWRQAEPVFREAFPDAEILYPYNRQDTTRLARQAVERHCAGVIAVGGEGTMNRVLQGLLEGDAAANTPMGVVPLGNVNDYTNNLGMAKNWRHALQVLQQGNTRQVGIVELRTENRIEYALNIADLGFGASTAQRHLNGELNWIKGRLKYNLLALKTLMHWQDIPARLEVDGETIEGDLAILLAGYSPTLGGFEVIPHARVDDDKMAITVGLDLSRGEIIRLLQDCKKRRLKASDKVRFYHASRILLETREPIFAQVDGEITSRSAHHIEMIAHPRRLKFFAP